MPARTARFGQRLQDHRRHQCLEAIGFDLGRELEPILEARLLDLEVGLQLFELCR